MSRATPDDQLKFLLKCVRYSNNGKIDFAEVAKECGIVSKGAAAKRYERLMKVNGIHPTGGPSSKLFAPANLREKSKTAVAKAASSKKRKVEEISAQIKAEDGDCTHTKPKLEVEESQRFKPSPVANESKLQLTTKSPPLPANAPIPSPSAVPIQFISPPPPFNPSSMPCHHSRPYSPHIAHLTHYSGPLMSLPPPPALPLSPLAQFQHPLQRSSTPPKPAVNFEETLIFEDFCTPELFEKRSFLEIPSAHQEVTMKNLCIEEQRVEERTLEEQPIESQRGRKSSESILVID